MASIKCSSIVVVLEHTVKLHHRVITKVITKPEFTFKVIAGLKQQNMTSNKYLVFHSLKIYYYMVKIFHLAAREKTFSTRETLRGLLSSTIAAANMGQPVICIRDGWAFVWQERLRNRSCWQHVGAELRAGERPGSRRETERSPQPTASAVGGLRGSLCCLDWDYKFALLFFTVFKEDTFLWFNTRAVESEQKTNKQTIHLLWWNYKLHAHKIASRTSRS